MRLTESQIRQIINSSIEARRGPKVYRLTELQLRRAVRHHIRTGARIDEGLLDFLKGALGDLMGAFTKAFKDAFGEAEGKLETAENDAQSQVASAIGGKTDVPAMKDLAPDKNPMDGALLAVYMAQYLSTLEDAAGRIVGGIDDVENPYPPADSEEAEEWSDRMKDPWASLSIGAGSIAAMSKAIAGHIPEAKAIQKDLEVAVESNDPLGILQGLQTGVEFWQSTVIPNMKQTANPDALEGVGAMKSLVQDAILNLEDMEGHFESISAKTTEAIPEWEKFKEESEADVEEAGGEEEEEMGEEGEEGIAVFGEEGGIGSAESVAGEAAGGEVGKAVGEAAGGPIGGAVGGFVGGKAGKAAGEKMEDKKKKEATIRIRNGQIILTEKQLKRLVHRLIIK